MTAERLRLCRSLLFLPASNPRAIEKVRGLAADMVVLDCEDAVKPEEKAMARSAAVTASDQGFGDRLCAIRINQPGTPWYEEDIAALRSCKADFVVLPKVEHHDQALYASVATEKPLLAMIETAKGVLSAADIAPATAGLIAGTNDLAADLGIPAGAGREGLAFSLQAILLAARSAGVAAFDGVYNKLVEDEALLAQCAEGRAFGFDGKTIIHPSHIAATNRIFGPSPEEVDAARRLIEASTGGAERFEGRMIEAMHVAQAEAVLAKARA